MASTNISHICSIPDEKVFRCCGGTELQHWWFRNNMKHGRAQDLFRMAEVKWEKLYFLTVKFSQKWKKTLSTPTSLLTGIAILITLEHGEVELGNRKF